MLTQDQLVIQDLGPRRVPSPARLSDGDDPVRAAFVPDRARVALEVESVEGQALPAPLYLEKAGPRKELFFEPAKVKAAIVTCGGLCPGINNVIRSLVLELHHKYGVRSILGVRYGYQGMNPAQGAAPIELTPSAVSGVHRFGGTFLGTARGQQDPAQMVDFLAERGVNMLFTIGGDGTLRGAHQLAAEAKRRALPLAVVGIPKTIDNDVPFVDRTFGFDTAVELARQALDSAHAEAVGARNGIGLVKLMGRDAGFIAAAATLASGEVNYCLVPEVPFELEGPHGLLSSLEQRLAERSHALIAVAEGCAVRLAGEVGKDLSGNAQYSTAAADVGPRLRDRLAAHFKQRGVPVTIKYIDPSYLVRSVPANANDATYCDRLARHAVHAGMAGKTDLVIGRVHGIFTHIPLPALSTESRRIVPSSGLWSAVTDTTGQPPLMAPT